MKKLINIHIVILQKQEELLARSAIEKKNLYLINAKPWLYTGSPPHFGYPKKTVSILVILASGRVNTAKVACAERAPKLIKIVIDKICKGTYE